VTPTPARFRDLLGRLDNANVRYVLVGGLAVNAWGYIRGTRDIDLVPDPSSENLAKLEGLLLELDGKVKVGDGFLGGDAISTFLRVGDRTLVVTELGEVDVLQGLPQVPSFAALEESATEVDLDGLSVKVCSLEHLMEMKRASDRPRDREDLEALEVAQEQAD
jgi:predicted nucleotidyltransferase